MDSTFCNSKKAKKLSFGKVCGRGWCERNDMKESCFTPDKAGAEGGGLLATGTPWSHGIGHSSVAKAKARSVSWL